MLKKISLNIEEELLKKIDAYGDSLGINRTSAISVLCASYIQQLEVSNTMGELIKKLDSIEKRIEVGK